MPSGLHIITSNRMEVLVSALADVLSSPPDETASPGHTLQPDIILVQSKGMQRWISMETAKINGVCANVEFPFPNAFIDRLCHLIDAFSGPAGGYDKQTLAFRIHHFLPELLGRPAFEPLKVYLTGDDTPLKQFQLCRKIADTFDQYAVFRPDWLLGWEEGRADFAQLPKTHQWQAQLWRALEAEQTGPHRAALQKQLVARLSRTQDALEGLPTRISIFGVSHLPPFHLQVLEALSQRIPVFLFLLNPCRHYWSDIVSDQQMVRLRSHVPVDLNQDAFFFERGNRLLAALGALGKQFFDLVHQCQAHHHEAFQENDHDRLLGRIQQDILDLVDRRRSGDEPPGDDVDVARVKADGTLRVHNCHSPMREIEVLFDQLLDMLANTPDLEPRDILVMAPDIGAYAPFIHAVFGGSSGISTKIPYTVADLSISRGNSTIDAFVQLLEMAESRMEASLVLSILSCRPVQLRFGLCETDLPVIHRWVREAGIRWGWDSHDRSRHGLPGFRENTWQDGLDRLILGLSMDSRQGKLFNEILPYESITPGEGESLGRFIDFAEALHDSLAQLNGNDTLIGWHERLNALFGRFFHLDQTAELEAQSLNTIIDRLREIGSRLKAEAAISFDVVRQYVKDSLKQTTYETGFMAGGVTFCAMLPMRSIPSKIICLLGMNHDTFPRENHEPGFNLIAVEPRLGDRSRRNDDRYLFLEALISARQTFYLSYVGQSIQDNSTMAPSVVVDELMEYVEEGLGVPSKDLLVRHPLHAFSTAYFDAAAPHLFSYSKENRDAAEALISTVKPQALFPESLHPPDEQWRQCDWADLSRFWTHPIRFLIENRLGVYLKPDGYAVEDRESFKLNAIERYHVNQELLKVLSRGVSEHDAYRFVRATNLLPHGTVGRVQCERLGDEVEKFLHTLEAILPKTKPRSICIEKTLPPFALHGEIDRIYPQGRIVYRMGKARPKDLLSLFVSHLALHFCTDQNVASASTLVCADIIWQLSPLERAEDILHLLMKHYWQGLQSPLPFYCQSSHTYAHQVLVNDRPPQEALSFAQRTWFGNAFSPGEASDPYHLLCFRDNMPLSDVFEKTALEVFEPFFTAAESFSAGDLHGEPTAS